MLRARRAPRLSAASVVVSDVPAVSFFANRFSSARSMVRRLNWVVRTPPPSA